MRYQGKVDQWFEDEGYGLIKSGDIMEPVILHISAIFHGQSKPKADDLVTFEVVETDQGRQAQNILYVHRTRPVIKPARFERPPRNKSYTAFIVMIIFGFLALQFLMPKSMEPLAVPEGKNAGNVSSSRAE